MTVKIQKNEAGNGLKATWRISLSPIPPRIDAMRQPMVYGLANLKAFPTLFGAMLRK